MMSVLRNTLIAAILLSFGGGVVLSESPEQWYREGHETVQRAIRLQPITKKAKNVILFIGDGMGVTTVTAARILEGQQRGESGEENFLSFEALPYTALIKTYETNAQTPDSAGTMTAMVTGVKTKEGVLSVNQNVGPSDAATVKDNKLTTIFELAERAGLATGVVSTTRITHATPAACYAHSPDRDWEDDADLPPDAKSADFPDIARQLIEFSGGDGLDVALGGGRRHFLPTTERDPEYTEQSGARLDGRNFTIEWLRQPNAAYVWNARQFRDIDVSKTDRLLGLFEPSHMQYEHDRPNDRAGEPSLSQMTAKAIDLLAKNDKGFILMIEGGRIDHGHHAASPYRALTDTIEFSNAVRTAINKSRREETLIIVTADHSHVFTLGGYATRGNPVLGKVVQNDDRGRPAKAPATDALGHPYTSLAYANGPGFMGASSDQPEGPKHYPHRGRGFRHMKAGRPDLTSSDTTEPDYLGECMVPLPSETHGGEDVALYADGPFAHLFRGVLEQNVIFHVMVHALGLPSDAPK